MAEVKIDLENDKIPREILDEIKLQTMKWERKRKESGVDELSESDRICQLEMLTSHLKSELNQVRRINFGLLFSILFTSAVSFGLTLARILGE